MNMAEYGVLDKLYLIRSNKTMKKVMIIILGISLFAEADFSRNDSKGIVTDSITGFQWQDDYRPNNPVIKKTTWAGAIDYCNDLVLGGYSDWRLPNINELLTIISFGKKDPCISNEFVYIKHDGYWSSTNAVRYESGGGGWVIYFDSGFQTDDEKYMDRYVRCVRD